MKRDSIFASNIDKVTPQKKFVKMTSDSKATELDQMIERASKTQQFKRLDSQLKVDRVEDLEKHPEERDMVLDEVDQDGVIVKITYGVVKERMLSLAKMFGSIFGSVKKPSKEEP